MGRSVWRDLLVQLQPLLPKVTAFTNQLEVSEEGLFMRLSEKNSRVLISLWNSVSNRWFGNYTKVVFSGLVKLKFSSCPVFYQAIVLAHHRQIVVSSTLSEDSACSRQSFQAIALPSFPSFVILNDWKLSYKVEEEAERKSSSHSILQTLLLSPHDTWMQII